MQVGSNLKTGKGTVVDVRTPGEFMGGNVNGSINIPLQEIPERLAELRALEQPLIVCCASGARSSSAQAYLTQAGFECFNAGPWYMVEQFNLAN